MTSSAAARQPGFFPHVGLARPSAPLLSAIILAFGFLLRLATLTVPHSYFPDEIFQYLEAAHRLAFGPAVVPWEYREGIRSWLVPLILAGAMRTGNALGSGEAYLLAAKLLLLTLSLLAVVAAGGIGRRISTMHGLFAMLAVASGAEFVYFSTVALTEPLGAVLFITAAALLYHSKPSSFAQMAGVGALLALTCVVRFQYGPAVAAFAMAALIRQPRQTLALATGALPLLAFSGIIDLAEGGAPFGWLLANVHQNVGLGRSHAWVDGPLYYPQTLELLWGVWLAPLLLLSIIGARRFPALMLVALTNVAVHSAIAHKEYRYILLSTMLVTILAGIGTADAIRWARRRSKSAALTMLPAIAVGGWLAMSASIAAAGPMRYWWTERQPELTAFALVRDTPDLCGVALYGIDWTFSGGYTYLHRPIPLFSYSRLEPDQLTQDRAQFDAIVLAQGLAVPVGFSGKACFGGGEASGVCVVTRPGKCAPPSSMAELNRQLIRAGR